MTAIITTIAMCWMAISLPAAILVCLILSRESKPKRGLYMDENGTIWVSDDPVYVDDHGEVWASKQEYDEAMDFEDRSYGM